ncbi:MAG: PQQ-binding-like beta-propeller repeat protein [Planctomycetota bacterium]
MKHTCILFVWLLVISTAAAADWLQFGRTSERNNVSPATGLPVEWNCGEFDRRTGAWKRDEAENILWVTPLGNESYGSPVIAAQKVFCATNNASGYLPRYPAEIDLGVLLCLDRASGSVLWQFSREKLAAGASVDWPDQGICSTPVVEGDRLWVVTNRGEVACLDVEGFRDGENDGPFTAEPSSAENEADVIWIFDMMGELGSVQHNMASCSPTLAGDLVLACTSNGVDDSHRNVPAPQAASFIALNKSTGKLVWADASPGENIQHGQWGSPAFGVLGGVPQAIFPGGDGWLYSFRAEATAGGKPELLWKFDCNPKEAVWKDEGRGDRSELVATPLIHEGRVYIATGHDPEFGEAPGHLWCIDPTKRGDVSPQLVVDRSGQPAPPRRVAAVDAAAGETVQKNPNSAALWHYTGVDQNGDGSLDYEETMHRSLGTPAIHEGTLVTGDLAGVVHCLDAATGKPYWTHDLLAEIWGTPLIADGRIYIGDADGEMAVFTLGREKELLAENDMGGSVYGAAAAVDGVLYIGTRTHIFAIGKQAVAPER